MRNKTKAIFILAAIILAISTLYFSGCTAKSEKPGLTYEEYLRTNPPPPRNLNGVFKVDHIELHWDVPEAVQVPHNYSDVIESYKIYRGTSIDKMSYLATTSNLTYNDFDVSGSPQYAYEVTAVHQGSTESSPSQEIIVRTSSVTKPQGSTPGLTYEEYLRVNPPPPRNLTGVFKADHIELRWDIPEAVQVPHNYADAIASYKIYRGTGIDRMSYLATTPDLTYNDFDVSGSPQYVYEVTAIHQGSTESSPSQGIIVRTSASKQPGATPGSTPGLTYEEYLRVNPPPPRNMTGVFKADHIELHWDIPETVQGAHNYSDVIVGYKIYRGTSLDRKPYLATTPGLTYNDFDVSGSPQYVYEVTAVHEGSTESAPSREVIVRTSAIIPSGGKVP